MPRPAKDVPDLELDVWVPLKQAANILGMSKAWMLWNIKQDGPFVVRRVGRCWFFFSTSLLEYLKKNNPFWKDQGPKN